MAAAHVATATGGSSSGTSDRTITFTPAVGELLIVIVAVAANTNNTPTVSDNNGSDPGTINYDRILIGNATISSINYRVSLHVRQALVTSATSTTVTAATGSNTSGVIHVVRVSGMAKVGSAAVRSSGQQNNQAAGTGAPTLNQNALTYNFTLAAIMSGDTTTTQPTGWTERADTNQSNDICALQTSTRDSGFTGTTITFGAAQSTVYATVAIELDGGALVDQTGVITSSSTPANPAIDPRLDASIVAATSSLPSAFIDPKLDASLIASGSSVSSPTVSVPTPVDPSIIASTATVANPTVDTTLEGSTIASAASVPAPVIGLYADPSTIASTVAAASPTVDTTLEASAIASGSSVAQPLVESAGFIDALVIGPGTSVPTAAVDVKLDASAIAGSSVVLTPAALDVVLLAPLLGGTTVPAPTVEGAAAFVDPDLLLGGAAVLAATIDVSFAVPQLTGTTVLAPSVSTFDGFVDGTVGIRIAESTAAAGFGGRTPACVCGHPTRTHAGFGHE